MTEDNSKTVSVIARFARNAISLLTSDVLNKSTTFVIYLLVARYFGARAFGQLSLGLMLFYVFQVFATAGLPTIITRSIAQRPGRTDRYCINGLAAAGCTGVVATFALFALTIVMQYEKDTAYLICLIALGVTPYGLAFVLESVFRGRERMHFIAVANVIANTVKIVGAVSLLLLGCGIIDVALLLVTVRWLILAIELGLYLKFIRQAGSRLSFRFIRRLLAHSFTFLGIDAVIASWHSVNILLLSKLATEVEVGIFSAATQLLHPIRLINQSIVAALFPSMCKKAAVTATNLVVITRWLVVFLALISMPAVVLLVPYADVLIALCYGTENMQQTIPLFRLIVVTLLISSTTSVFGNALWAIGRERAVLRIVTLNLAVNLVLGFGLIELYGLWGAAWTLLLIALFNGAQHWYAFVNVIGKQPIDRAVLMPISAAGLMALTVGVLYWSNHTIAAVSGVTVYIASVATILRCSHGNVRDLPARYFAPLLES